LNGFNIFMLNTAYNSRKQGVLLRRFCRAFPAPFRLRRHSGLQGAGGEVGVASEEEFCLISFQLSGMGKTLSG